MWKSGVFKTLRVASHLHSCGMENVENSWIICKLCFLRLILVLCISNNKIKLAVSTIAKNVLFQNRMLYIILALNQTIGNTYFQRLFWQGRKVRFADNNCSWKLLRQFKPWWGIALLPSLFMSSFLGSLTELVMWGPGPFLPCIHVASCRYLSISI